MDDSSNFPVSREKREERREKRGSLGDPSARIFRGASKSQSVVSLDLVEREREGDLEIESPTEPSF